MREGGVPLVGGPPESEIRFALRHFVLAEIKGRVARWRGTFVLDTRRPSRSQVDVIVDAASLETGDPERDEHIRSPEFLDVRAFPEIRFRSSDVHPEPDGWTYTLTGDLAIRDITRRLTFTVSEQDGRSTQGPAQMRVFVGHAVVDRQKYGLHWNQDLDQGGLVVGDNVDVALRIVLQNTAAVRSVTESHAQPNCLAPECQEVPT